VKLACRIASGETQSDRRQFETLVWERWTMDIRFEHRRPGWEGAFRETSRGRATGARRRRGFSLIELIVVLAVTAVLASILFPAFRGVRESAQRLACASNMRQIGLAMTMYSDHNERYLPNTPYGTFVGNTQSGPRDLVNASLGEHRLFFGNLPPESAWTGLAWLLPTTLGGAYLDSPSVLYSPSYRGSHTFERYQQQFRTPDGSRIVTNYHYCGHVVFGTDILRRLTGGHQDVLVATGMRSASEMNQRDGTNVLHGDCAVLWFGDATGRLRSRVADIEVTPPAQHPQMYLDIWKLLSKGE